MCPEVVTRWAVLTQRLSPHDEPKAHQIVKSADGVTSALTREFLFVLPAHRDLRNGPSQPASAEEHLRVEAEAKRTQRLEASDRRLGRERLETALRVVEAAECGSTQQSVVGAPITSRLPG